VRFGISRTADPEDAKDHRRVELEIARAADDSAAAPP
jgi:hypothetical protein